MAISYSWEISHLKVEDKVNSEGVTLQNAVCSIEWAYVGVTEDGETVKFPGSSRIDAFGVGSSDFIPFNSLTKATVEGWLNAQDQLIEMALEQIAVEFERRAQRAVATPW
jgi:hypothetical protein